MPKIPGKKIEPKPLAKNISVSALIENYFTAYNAARLSEICLLFAKKVMKPEVTVGLTLSGALTPAGLGTSILAPLIKNGYVDWIVSTGANLYHDMHYALNCELFAATPFMDDAELRKRNIIRIYDILFDFEVLARTDAFLLDFLKTLESKTISTAELHHRLGRHVAAAQKKHGVKHDCLLTAAYKADVPLYTSSPGDSTIGMNVAAANLIGQGPLFDPSLDVNETTAIVHEAKRKKNGKSAVWILGGGSPKNFILQTEPQIQEILRIPEKGHDFMVQITDARPDTGGLSGATPHEAVSWGKIDPSQIPDTVVCYADTTIVLPLITAYLLERAPKRPLRRLFKRREELVENLLKAHLANKENAPRQHDAKMKNHPCGG
jgi:deoxyhypusine synthase